MAYKTITIQRPTLVHLIKCSVGRAKYRLGAKPKMEAIPGTPGFLVADCSGYVRWLLYNLGVRDVPDGSWNQERWCITKKFKPTDYSNAGLRDDRLRIAFISPKAGTPGHVVLVINAQTIESYGGVGTGRRPWNTPVLLKRVDACYVLTDPLTPVKPVTV